MRQFFKFIFASCLGVLLAGFVLFGIGGAIIGKMIAKETAGEKIKPNSVLKLNFNQPIPERTNNLATDFSDFNTEKTLGLHDIVASIESAKTDDDIKGIFLNLTQASGGQATKTVLRKALNDFKESGKFVIAYSKGYSQGRYYLASVADKIYLNPVGDFDFRGYGAQVTFFKKMLDNVGIDMQIIRAGKFKGAGEPFLRTDLSEENRLQIREYLNGMYDVFISDIAESRNISENTLRQLADDFTIRNPEDALSHKLVDVLGYYDEVLSEIKVRVGLDEDDKLRFVSLNSYAKNKKSDKDYSTKDKVAVVYAEGGISTGKGEPGTIGDEKYMKILRKIRRDDKIKAVVLRVNSGGGSALASDNIWRELQLIKEAGKPVVASMGDVAASGGYYISCDADKIFAEESTITGSIGVFGTIPNTQELMNDEIGITFDTVSTGRYSNSFSPVYKLSENERNIVQTAVNDIYRKFLERVAKGRDMSIDSVDKIAQGRVWTGTKAKEIGLVDEIGGLEDAIAAAQELANLEKYRLKEYPVVKEPIEQFMDEFMNKDEDTQILQQTIIKSQLQEFYPYYKKAKTLRNMKGVQMRIPFEVIVE